MRRVLVTGANKGIGKAIVEAILDQHDDTFVLLGSRDEGRGEAARAELVAEHPAWSERLEVLPIDVADEGSVALAAERARSRFEGDARPLFGLVNNAGVGRANSLDEVVNVNLRGVQRVTEAFLPLLDPESGRIVNVTSASGPNFVSACSPERQRQLTDPSITREQLDALTTESVALPDDAAFAEQGLGKRDAYGLSKALANAYTLLVAREHPSLGVNACTPGFIETDLTRRYAEQAGKSPAEMGMKSPAEGTRSTLRLLFGELEGNGRYYGSDGLRSPMDRYRSPGDPEYTGD